MPSNIGELGMDGLYCKLSDEAHCLREETMTLLNRVGHGLHAGPKILDKLRPERIASLMRIRAVGFYAVQVRTLDRIKRRAMVRVVINNVQCWADTVTGTLYSSDGACKTSDVMRLNGTPKRLSAANTRTYFNSLSYLTDSTNE